jgi:hypothetical protein
MLTNKNPVGLAPKDGKEFDHEIFQILSRAFDRNEVRLESPVYTKDIRLEGIERILSRMLQGDADKRYDDYTALLADVKRVQKGKLPTRASPELVGTAFKPAEYSNYFTYAKQRMVRNFFMAGTGVAAAAFTAYKLGYLRPVLEFITSKIGQ